MVVVWGDRDTLNHNVSPGDLNPKNFKKYYIFLVWWLTPLTPALKKQRQVDLCDFMASPVYKTSSTTARALTQRNPVLRYQNNNKNCINRQITGIGLKMN